jgi:hypothetical protein
MNRRNFFATLFALPLTPMLIPEKPTSKAKAYRLDCEQHPMIQGWTTTSAGGRYRTCSWSVGTVVTQPTAQVIFSTMEDTWRQ